MKYAADIYCKVLQGDLIDPLAIYRFILLFWVSTRIDLCVVMLKKKHIMFVWTAPAGPTVQLLVVTLCCSNTVNEVVSFICLKVKDFSAQNSFIFIESCRGLRKMLNGRANIILIEESTMVQLCEAGRDLPGKVTGELLPSPRWNLQADIVQLPSQGQVNGKSEQGKLLLE